MDRPRKTLAALLVAAALLAGCSKGAKTGAPAQPTAQASAQPSAPSQPAPAKTSEQRSQELKAQAEALLAKNPGDLQGHLLLGAAALARDDYPAALQAYQQAAAADPKSPLPPGYVGNVYRMQQKWAEAEAWYKKALALDPRWQQGYVNLAVTYELWGKPQEAARVAAQAAEFFPGALDIQILAGNTHKAAGDKARARSYYEAALKIDPNNATVKSLLAELDKP